MNTIITEQDELSFAELGWFAHIVTEGCNTPYNGYNYHTHGFETSYGHKNIQIVMPLDPRIAHQIVWTIVGEIKKGVKFEPGIEYENLVGGGYKVKFIEAKECGREVLRLLVPDKNGRYDGQFADQLTMLDDNDGLLVEEKVYQVD